ncbi:Fused isobutyryl-CoA mutase [Dyadobacter sp. CECT 9275]|uniref:Fused isobutyryl-CoA mutase n=1 Tax=Dyadobacter helix TaxID=2822344 RepID=A0A916JAD6_9BACT|nr:methylmalonyl-CoA mutase family protein [Dyadobacter sp. CECT 9275]CAG4994886.1 Fused isobutyryl-CoA mutase [Dyadobacter sp. CECT 9275]
MTDHLFKEFEIPQPFAWKNLAEKELGAPLSEIKRWIPSENLVFSPYATYDGRPAEESDSIRQCQRSDTGWLNTPLLRDYPLEEAVEKIGHLIQNGADAILLDPVGTAPAPADLHQLLSLLQSINTRFFFQPKNRDNNIIKEIYNFGGLKAGGIALDPVAEWLQNGSDFRGYLLHISELVQTKSTAKNFFPLLVQSHVFQEAGADPVQELALCLATLVLDLDILTNTGLSPEKALSLIYFSIPCGPQYLTEIAKLRAFRSLHVRIAQCYDIKVIAEPFIHSTTSAFHHSEDEPYTNMIRTTAQAMSAVTGGCNALTVYPFDQSFKTPNDFSERIARNVSLILSHESSLNRVADPAAGSYLIEDMTLQLADSAWNLFLEIEEKGGIVPYFLSGDLRRLLDQRWNEQIEALKKDDVMVGVNKYVQQTENRVKTTMPPVPWPPYLPKRNLARDYHVSISQAHQEKP